MVQRPGANGSKTIPGCRLQLEKDTPLEPKLVAIHMELGQAYVLMHRQGQCPDSLSKRRLILPRLCPCLYSAMGDIYYQTGQEAEAFNRIAKPSKSILIAAKVFAACLLLAEKPEICQALKLCRKGGGGWRLKIRNHLTLWVGCKSSKGNSRPALRQLNRPRVAPRGADWSCIIWELAFIKTINQNRRNSGCRPPWPSARSFPARLRHRIS